MNGASLTLGTLGALVAAGLLRQRGSRNDRFYRLVRGVLVAPDGTRTPVKLLGQGSFATAYVTVGETPPRVFVFTDDDVYDKELLAMAKDADPDNPHLPQVEKIGDTATQTVYVMPLYRTPLRKVDDPAGFAEVGVLKRCREAAYEGWFPSRSGGVGKRGYRINDDTIDCAKSAGVRASTLEALEILRDTAANYSDEYVFEFAPRNLGTDAEGNLVLLDPLYDREKLQKRQAAAIKKREAADAAKRRYGWP